MHDRVDHQPRSPREYLPSERHISSSIGRFVNFIGSPPTPELVWAEFPDAVIIDGSDDWNAPAFACPYKLRELFAVPVLALFHTGISGITRSGLVVTREVFESFARQYQAAFPDKRMEDLLRCYVPSKTSRGGEGEGVR